MTLVLLISTNVYAVHTNDGQKDVNELKKFLTAKREERNPTS
jgi:hypothetical protein